MKREELIKFCLYYKGEESNPVDRITGDRTRGLFWDIECLFVSNAENNDAFLDGYKALVEDYIKSNPGVENDLTSKNWPIVTKCIILFVEDILVKWVPDEVDLVFKYGNIL